MKLTKQEKRVYEDVLLVIVGFVLMLVIPRYLDPNFGLLFLIVGSALAAVSLIDVWRAIFNKPFINLKKVQKPRRIHKTKSFRKDEEGIVWIWAVAVATLIMGSVVYFIVRYPLDLIIQVVMEDNGFAFTGVMGATFDLCRMVVDWLLGFVVFGVLLWVFVNAYKRSADYPAIG